MRSAKNAKTDPSASAESRSDVAYVRLKGAIQSGRFGPGTRMREADLASWLGVSRTPVRDALKQLQSDGLLVAAPRRGLVVTELDHQQVSEIYAVRDVLEGLAGRLAAQHATAAEISAMRYLLDRQAQTPSTDVATLARLNELFHDSIYRSARNRYLTTVLDSFESTLALLPGTTYVDPDRPRSALEEHVALVDAIEQQAPDEAESIARAHIRAAERIRLLMLTGPADLFDTPTTKDA